MAGYGSWLPVAQLGMYLAISPLSVGIVDWRKARAQRRRGPGPLQPYRDLVKLLRIRPSVPASASGVFLLAPPAAFVSYLILGLALPTVYPSQRRGPDLLLVVALIGLAKFAVTLAAFDCGSPIGPLSGARQWFIHVLAEPALLVTSYVYAVSRHTTDLSTLTATRAGDAGVLLSQPALPLAVGTLLFVLLAETGRLPFDRPGTHLELTMIDDGVALEYSGQALALLWWAGAMKLTFALSLVASLALPPGLIEVSTPRGLALSTLAYLAKLGFLLVALAWWESIRGKLRVRSILTPLMLATGVLLFALVTLVVTLIQPNS
jgi:formate hydrogenlyase subunit 4